MLNEPLKPTNLQKARKLLKKEKSVVVSAKPFVTRLTEAPGEAKQDTDLGMKAGYQNVSEYRKGRVPVTCELVPGLRAANRNVQIAKHS
jgi:ribosomal protein L15E